MVLYYVAGAALRASLGTVQAMCARLSVSSDIASSVSGALICCLSLRRADAEAAGLPVQLLSQRETGEGRMLYVSNALFNIVLQMESDVLKPCLASPFCACMLGNDFGVYLYGKLQTCGVHDILFKVCIDSLVSEGVVGATSSEIPMNVAVLLCESICNKYLTFFMKVVVCEYVKQIKTSTSYSKDVNKLAFRVQAMLENVRVVPVVSTI